MPFPSSSPFWFDFTLPRVVRVSNRAPANIKRPASRNSAVALMGVAAGAAAANETRNVPTPVKAFAVSAAVIVSGDGVLAVVTELNVNEN